MNTAKIIIIMVHGFFYDVNYQHSKNKAKKGFC